MSRNNLDAIEPFLQQIEGRYYTSQADLIIAAYGNGYIHVSVTPETRICKYTFKTKEGFEIASFEHDKEKSFSSYPDIETVSPGDMNLTWDFSETCTLS